MKGEGNAVDRLANRKVHQVMAAVVRRLKASGLPQDALAVAIEAAKGKHAAKNEPIELGVRMRDKLFKLVQSHGPLVLTGRKALKVFTIEGYRSHCSNASKNATTHKPWLLVGHTKDGKTVAAKPKRIHWTQKPENAGKLSAAVRRMNEAKNAKTARAAEQLVAS